MPRKNSESRNSKPSSPDVLRTVSDDKAFYFYKEFGMPLGVKANSLEDLARKAGNVEAVSIQFHVTRRDFENWVKMLGDATLAGQIAEIGSKGLPATRSQEHLMKTLQSRISEIKKRKK